jgi:hypothetical protein
VGHSGGLLQQGDSRNAKQHWVGPESTLISANKGSGASSGLGAAVKWLASSRKGADALMVVVLFNRDAVATASPEELDEEFFSGGAGRTAIAKELDDDVINVGGRCIGCVAKGVLTMGRRAIQCESDRVTLES